MLILAIRTDKPEAELGLLDGGKELTYEIWQAHRELAETIHKKIDGALKSQGKKLHQLQGVVVFKGPGSFTGLRIGITVANTFANSLQIPIVSSQGMDWVQAGVKRLQKKEDETVALPEYGGEPNVTRPKH